MSKIRQVHNWRLAYLAFRQVGMKDVDIATLAGVSRAVINAVANGTYNRNHELGFNGGIRVLTKLKELKDHGQLPNFVFDDLGASPGSTQRSAVVEPGAGLGGADGVAAGEPPADGTGG